MTELSPRNSNDDRSDEAELFDPLDQGATEFPAETNSPSAFSQPISAFWRRGLPFLSEKISQVAPDMAIAVALASAASLVQLLAFHAGIQVGEAEAAGSLIAGIIAGSSLSCWPDREPIAHRFLLILFILFGLERETSDLATLVMAPLLIGYGTGSVVAFLVRHLDPWRVEIDQQH